MPDNQNPQQQISVPSQNGTDQVKIQSLQTAIGAKVDTNNSLEHTFTGTTEESFEHRFGRVPMGAFVVSQSQHGTIKMDKTKWTVKRLFMTSSVANNAVTFILV